jgi:predicted ATP-grasp superfamily ATP-dependent carboligase
MDCVRWESRPVLRRPVVVLAFEGWNDAGEAASLAVQYLAGVWNAERFAVIDPEEFYDFTSARPHTRIVDGQTRAIDWPEVELMAARMEGADRDIVFVRGPEPQLRWRTFTSAIVDVLEAVGATTVLTLGALLADVPHSRPVRVSGGSDDRALAAELGVSESNYEGPTGIIGVVSEACSKAGMGTASFWAAVPHYVHQLPSPKAALALVERAAAAVGTRVNPLELRVAAEEYERQVSAKVADDADAAAYVAQLEEADEDEPGPIPLDPDRLTDEVERWLREHPGDAGR